MRARSYLGAALPAVVAIGFIVGAAPSVRADAEHPQWDEWEVLRHINDERGARGLPAVEMARPAREVARGWSEVMSSDGQLRHNPELPDQISERLPTWQRAGENVGVGSDVGQLHDAFMDSHVHRDNVLGDFRWVGVGARWSGGRLWVAIDFAATSAPIESATPYGRYFRAWGWCPASR